MQPRDATEHLCGIERALSRAYGPGVRKTTIAAFAASITTMLAWSCGSEQIGSMLVDAGNAIRDGGAANAQEGVVMEAACDQTIGDANTTRYFAEFDVPSLMPSDAPRIEAYMCDWSQDPPCGSIACMKPTTCVQTVVGLSPGRVVVECGLRLVTTSTEEGRYQRAYLRIN